MATWDARKHAVKAWRKSIFFTFMYFIFNHILPCRVDFCRDHLHKKGMIKEKLLPPDI